MPPQERLHEYAAPDSSRTQRGLPFGSRSAEKVNNQTEPTERAIGLFIHNGRPPAVTFTAAATTVA